jgi:molybdate-binding protein
MVLRTIKIVSVEETVDNVHQINKCLIDNVRLIRNYLKKMGLLNLMIKIVKEKIMFKILKIIQSVLM